MTRFLDWFIVALKDIFALFDTFVFDVGGYNVSFLAAFFVIIMFSMFISIVIKN